MKLRAIVSVSATNTPERGPRPGIAACRPPADRRRRLPASSALRARGMARRSSLPPGGRTAGVRRCRVSLRRAWPARCPRRTRPRSDAPGLGRAARTGAAGSRSWRGRIRARSRCSPPGGTGSRTRAARGRWSKARIAGRLRPERRLAQAGPAPVAALAQAAPRAPPEMAAATRSGISLRKITLQAWQIAAAGARMKRSPLGKGAASCRARAFPAGS